MPDQVQLVKITLAGVAEDEKEELVKAGLASERLPKGFGSRSELVLASQRVAERMRKHLLEAGYYLSSVDSSQLIPLDSAQRAYEFTYRVVAGQKYVVGDVSFVGNDTSRSEGYQSRFETSEGDVLNTATLQSDIQSLLKDLEREGHPLAQVDIVSIEPTNDGKLNITLHVSEGPSAMISKISVRGNTVTSERVIVRETGIPIGAAFSPIAIEESRRRLERLSYFSRVDGPEVRLLPDSSIELVYVVEEGRTTTVDAVLGYNPPPRPTESGYITGLADLAFKNIAGTARDASLHYSRQEAGTQRLAVAYREPWLFAFPLHASVSFDQLQQDSTLVTTALGGALTYALTGNVTASAALNYERVIPSEIPEIGFIAYNSQKLLTTLSAAYDTRDNLASATRGVYISGSGTYGSKRLNGPIQFLSDSEGVAATLSRIDLSMESYSAVFSPKMILAIAAKASRTAVFGSALDMSEVTRLGGIRSIRGYRDNELLATRYAYGNVEFRFLTGRLSYLYLFSDAGWLERGPLVTDTTTSISYPLSYGFGAQQDTPIGILSVSLALPKGESFDRTKVHFGILTNL